MNILKPKTTNINSTEQISNVNKKKSPSQNDSDIKFSEELNNVKKNNNVNKTQKEKNEHNEVQNEEDVKDCKQELLDDNIKDNENVFEQTEELLDKEKPLNNIDNAVQGLSNILEELNTLNQTDEKNDDDFKFQINNDDKLKKEDKQKEVVLIDNNMNIQEPKDKILLQDSANMNFNSDGQPFTDFVKENAKKEILSSTAKELDEEKAILSTMEENIAIANKNMALAKTKTVENEHGVQKVDKKTNLVVDTIVSYDRVVMDKADVEFFTNLVENGIIDINEVKGAEKSSRVSKALADLLVKAMNDNKPVRIDFDNNISVIIKIDRAGKISAEFLPSSQVAEAYLKENLPLLRQRFDDNDIDYNELSQRQRKQQENQNNRKKESKDE